MKRRGEKTIFSPHDLINFMHSEFVTWMDLRALDDKSLTPDQDNASARILQEKGFKHEGAYLEALKSAGKRIVEIPDGKDGYQLTLEAMRSGADVVFQAQLQHHPFAGIADFLSKVDGESALGSWHYEVWDTKLAKRPKPEFLIQLCCYADMLQALQGKLPARMGIALGAGEHAIRTLDYFFFYEQLKRAFLEYVSNVDLSAEPENIIIPDFCRWASHGDEILNRRDDLILVANIRRQQIKKLNSDSITTVKQLADCDFIARKLSEETFKTLKRQAKLQVQTRETNEPIYELLAEEEGRRGFKLLPPHNERDIYFDMEGYPLVEGGLEYLFGATHVDDQTPEFTCFWAHSSEEEKHAFKDFVTWAHKRWSESPQKGMHIYHYGNYELAAMRRLAQKHGVCESQLDDLLRNGVFVDLFMIVRQSMQVGEKSYSIKYIEHFYRAKRKEAVATAVDSIVFYDRYIEEQDPALLDQIRDYNKVDCDSTMELTHWLRERQKESGIAYEAPSADDGGSEEQTKPSRANLTYECAVYSERLLSELDSIADPQQRAKQELLAWLLRFHEREQKPLWWEVFERASMDQDQLFDDADCLGWLKLKDVIPASGRKLPRHRYSFDPEQETSLRAKSQCFAAHDVSITATIEEIERKTGTLVLRAGGGANVPQILGLIPDERVRGIDKLQSAILSTVSAWKDTGKLPPAMEHFLDRAIPSINGIKAGAPLYDEKGDITKQAIDIVSNMSDTTLCVQGPPGCGKTTIGAEIIVELIKQGKKVGITSNSHEAINNLLTAINAKAQELNCAFNGLKIGGDNFSGPPNITQEDSSKADAFLSGTYQVIGGTAWAFCIDEAVDYLDYLFVDEAGQVSLANLLAISRSTRNIVLLGDQMQLQQPLKGSHPGDSGKSTLTYYLGDSPTVSREQGVFLGRTWRMHPDVCSVISSAVYEDRLLPEATTAKRVLVLPTTNFKYINKTAGVLYLPVEHEDNVQDSKEERACIREIIDELLQCEVITNRGTAQKIALSDILVVAPFNRQVRLLREELPQGMRVGTVDKFQGQQAPVSILSMSASDGNSSPRGLAFLFDKHRLNVALSRAQSLAIVVGAPQLAHTKCTTLKNMELVNFYCRLVQTGNTGKDQATLSTTFPLFAR